MNATIDHIFLSDIDSKVLTIETVVPGFPLMYWPALYVMDFRTKRSSSTERKEASSRIWFHPV